jgi:hypothetical protein
MADSAAGKVHVHCCFGMQKRDFGRNCALWWNHELRSKPCRSISGEFSLSYMWIKSSFSLVVCDHAQTWKHRTQSQNLDCSSSPTIQPTSSCLKFSSLWSPLRCHQWGKGLGVMTRLLKKWRNGCEYKIQTYWKGTGRGEMLLFLAGSLLLKLVEIM